MVEHTSSAQEKPCARKPLDAARIVDCACTHGPYRDVVVTKETGSTNSDLVAYAAQNTNASWWAAAVTDHQIAGKGRKGRVWVAPAQAQVTLSVLFYPSEKACERIGTMPLIAGLALIDVLAAHAIPVSLKWPNDVLLNGKKICGILGEMVPHPVHPALVLGLGLNVHLTPDELPVSTATSLDIEGYRVDRTDLAIDILLALHRRLMQWHDADARLLSDYRAHCSTIGAQVKVQLTEEDFLLGTCVGIAEDGRVLVREKAGALHALSAGDVTHMRLAT